MKKQTFILPKKYTYHYDLNKQWYVYYSFFSVDLYIMKRFKVYGSINQYQTVNEREKECERIVLEYTHKLKNGYNPFIDLSQRLDKDSINQKIKQILDARLHRLRLKSRQSYTSKIDIFCKWLEITKLQYIKPSQFTAKQAESFLIWLRIERNLNNTTVNHYHTTLKSFFQDICSETQYLSNVWDKVDKYPETRLGKLPFKESQKARLKDWMQANDMEMWLFIQFMYYTFIRPGELRLLKISAIDVDDSKILVDATISKNKKSEYVSIPKPLLKAILERELHLKNQQYYVFGYGGTVNSVPYSKDVFNRRHKKITRAMGMSDRYTLYSWKHTGVCDAVKAGVNIKQLQLQLRHADLETTDVYLKSLGISDFSDIQDKFPTL